MRVGGECRIGLAPWAEGAAARQFDVRGRQEEAEKRARSLLDRWPRRDEPARNPQRETRQFSATNCRLAAAVFEIRDRACGNTARDDAHR